MTDSFYAILNTLEARLGRPSRSVGEPVGNPLYPSETLFPSETLYPGE